MTFEISFLKNSNINKEILLLGSFGQNMRDISMMLHIYFGQTL